RRLLERIEVPQGLRVDRRLRGALAGGRRFRSDDRVPGLQVAVVDRELQVLAVHVGNQVRHARLRLHVGVGHVPPQADRVLEGLVVPGALSGAGDPRGHPSCRHDREQYEPERLFGMLPPLVRTGREACLLPARPWVSGWRRSRVDLVNPFRVSAMSSVQDRSIPLSAGTEAPEFTLHSTPDQRVSLSEFRGKPVILAFYPEDWSPVCSDQLALYQEL